jgi:hypothetical protein
MYYYIVYLSKHKQRRKDFSKEEAKPVHVEARDDKVERDPIINAK